jgi:hypothetical protein
MRRLMVLTISPCDTRSSRLDGRYFSTHGRCVLASPLMAVIVGPPAPPPPAAALLLDDDDDAPTRAAAMGTSPSLSLSLLQGWRQRGAAVGA